MPYRQLSNFWECRITFNASHVTEAMADRWPRLREWLGGQGCTFASSEHVWQSLKAATKEDFDRFHGSGDLANFNCLSPAAALVIFPSKKEKKGATDWTYWSRRQCCGVIAKMAVNGVRARKLHLQVDIGCEFLPRGLELDTWHAILRQKYTQNPLLAAVLRSTSHAPYLLEFSRSAQAREKKQPPSGSDCNGDGSKEYWGGLIDMNGVLYGQNVMGRLMMDVRKFIIDASSTPDRDRDDL